MSRGEFFARFNASARRYLEPEVGAVQDIDDTVQQTTVEKAIAKICRERGHAIEPERGETVKWIGRH